MPVLEPRWRGEPAEPDVYFRIVHVALDTANGATAYHEQTVEIALGPKGAFENGNIGTLTRHVPADRVVNALPPPPIGYGGSAATSEASGGGRREPGPSHACRAATGTVIERGAGRDGEART